MLNSRNPCVRRCVSEQLVFKFPKSGKSDPYCNLKIGKYSSYKSKIQNQTLTPHWQEEFFMQCPESEWIESFFFLKKKNPPFSFYLFPISSQHSLRDPVEYRSLRLRPLRHQRLHGRRRDQHQLTWTKRNSGNSVTSERYQGQGEDARRFRFGELCVRACVCVCVCACVMCCYFVMCTSKHKYKRVASHEWRHRLSDSLVQC